MENLTKIYKHYKGSGKSFKHGSDKGTRHSYIKHYEAILSPFVGKSACILELGVASGKSLMMWEEYLQNAHIYGVDICNKPKLLDNHPSIVFRNANAGSASELETVTAGLTFDIIIDDASHLVADQLVAFAVLFPKLKPGGAYIIEDVDEDSLKGLNSIVDKHDVTVVGDRKTADDTLVVIKQRIQVV